MEYFLKNLYKNELKKECSSIGLYLFVSNIIMMIASYFLMVVVMLPTLENPDNTETFLITGIASIVGIFIVSLIYCKVAKVNISETIPMNKTKASVVLPLLLFGFAGTFIANYISAILNLALTPFKLTTDLDSAYGSMNWIEFLLFAISVSIIPALVEEFAFRGIVMGKLRKYGDSFAIFLSAILFGMMHGNIAQIPFAFMVGLILGFIAVKANSLLPAIIVHFFNNFISVLFTTISENKLFSDDIANIIYIAIMLIIIILAIISIHLLSKDKSFFKINDNTEQLTFKEKLSAGFGNVGTIFFTGYVFLSTVYYIIIL